MKQKSLRMVKMQSTMNFLDGLLVICIKPEDKHEERYILKCKDAYMMMFIVPLCIIDRQHVLDEKGKYRIITK